MKFEKYRKINSQFSSSAQLIPLTHEALLLLVMLKLKDNYASDQC